MDFTKKLNNAMLDFTSVNKIVVKVKDCSMECVPVGSITKCQEVCAFGAISINTEDNKIYVDEAKCIDCGFCIEACPNACFLDKTEFSLQAE